MLNHINKTNLHHAYLIEGGEDILNSLLGFIKKELDIETVSNPDFYFKKYDTFKIDDARFLISIKDEKSIKGDKKIVIIQTNSVLREAQNAMLKMFEEPILDTIFFLIVKDKNILLPTFFSRFYFVPNADKNISFEKEANDFIKMNLKDRLEFIKILTVKVDEDEEGFEAPRYKALEFLNALEFILSQKENQDKAIFNKIFEIRSFLRDPSSQAKMLLEAIAISL